MTRIIPETHCPNRKSASPIFIFISSVRIWAAKELSDLAEDARIHGLLGLGGAVPAAVVSATWFHLSKNKN